MSTTVKMPCRAALQFHRVALGAKRCAVTRQLLAVFLSGLACLAMTEMALAEGLRVAVSVGPVSLPIYVAQAQGFFTQEGVALQLHDCSSGSSCLQMQAQGQADLATVAELPVTLGSLSGTSDAVILATISSSARHIKLVARGGAGLVKVPGDLRGKRVATVGGTSAQYFLDSWLVFHEIDPNDVRVTLAAPDQLIGALARKEVDAIAIWEPIASKAMAALGPDAVVMPNPRIYTQHFNLVAGRDAVVAHEADIGRLLRALARAQQFIAKNPRQASRILATRLPGISGQGALSEHDFRLTLDQSLIATMDSQARWAVRQGLFPQAGKPAVNLLHSIDPAPLRKAVPGAVVLVQ